jgi:hypothetical protein
VLGDGAIDAGLIIDAIVWKGGEWIGNQVEHGFNLRAIIDIMGINSDARTCPVSASPPTCSLRQNRRLRVPCVSIGQALGPPSRRPVRSTRAMAVLIESEAMRRVGFVIHSSRPTVEVMSVDQVLLAGSSSTRGTLC